MSTSTDIERSWARVERWAGITRPYQADDVDRLRGTLPLEHTLASHGAARLWWLLREEPYVAVLSALTGNQAVQEVRAGLKAIYISGWQVAADANCAMTTYPDQSLYPSDSVPNLLNRIQNALRRADEIHHLNGDHSIDWHVPLVADAEAGFGGVLNAYELMKLMIAAGAAGVHFEDQLSSVKKCGHLGGKVLVPTSEFVTKLISARLAADVCGVDTMLIARTDANSAGLLTSDVDEYDRPWCTGERSPEGFFVIKDGVGAAIARARAYAPYADLQWREFALERDGYEAVKHQEFVGVGYFDEITQIVSGGRSSTMALEGSTERAQFAGNGHKGVAGRSPVVS